MVSLNLLIAALLATRCALCCSCGTTGSACDWLRGTGIVFVGQVIEDSGEGLGKGLARMTVEEILQGLSKDLAEVSVDTSAGTSCYMRLKKGERYVIYGSPSPGVPERISRNLCSFSFAVAGNESLLNALRESAKGAGASLVGKVQMKRSEYDVSGAGAAGVRVVAIRGKTHLETLTQPDGQFEFLNVAPGQYHLSVASEGVFEDKWRWPSEDPRVPAPGCGYQNLFVWPNGKVEGTVRGADGAPLAGVVVQAFTNDRQGKLDSSPLREDTTGSNGRYSLRGLPPGDCVIGVNGEEYKDRSPWPSRFYPGTPDRDSATRLRLAAGQAMTGIDLDMGPPRTPAVLYIETVFEDGTPALDAVARVENLSGVQRAFASRGEHSNVLKVQLYVGETYRVKVFRHHVEASEPVGAGRPIRMRTTSWSGVAAPVQVGTPELRLRVVLHEEQE